MLDCWLELLLRRFWSGSPASPWEGSRRWFKYLDPCHHCGKLGWDSWPSPNLCKSFGAWTRDSKISPLSLSIILLSKINKIHLFKEVHKMHIIKKICFKFFASKWTYLLNWVPINFLKCLYQLSKKTAESGSRLLHLPRNSRPHLLTQWKPEAEVGSSLMKVFGFGARKVSWKGLTGFSLRFHRPELDVISMYTPATGQRNKMVLTHSHGHCHTTMRQVGGGCWGHRR